MIAARKTARKSLVALAAALPRLASASDFARPGLRVDDLRQALGAAGIRPPYLLVGNSLGGANVQLYAYRYPAQGEQPAAVTAAVLEVLAQIQP